MHRNTALLIIVILLCASSALGRGVNYQFTSISIEEGLSQSTVQSILLDKKEISIVSQTASRKVLEKGKIR